MTSWTTHGFVRQESLSLKSLCDFEKEYGFFAEQGRSSSIFALAGFSYLEMTRSWKRLTSGRTNESLDVAINGSFRSSGVRSSKK